jgi:hypothetical protein
MHGMSRSNASFALCCFRAGAAPTVVLTLLGFARLKCRSPALDTRATAFGCAAQALDFPICCKKLSLKDMLSVFACLHHFISHFSALFK